MQQQQAKIDTIYQSAPIGLGALNRELRFVRVNQRLAEMNGLPVEAHWGRTIRDLLSNLADQTEAILRPILATGEPLLKVGAEGIETPQRRDILQDLGCEFGQGYLFARATDGTTRASGLASSGSSNGSGLSHPPGEGHKQGLNISIEHVNYRRYPLQSRSAALKTLGLKMDGVHPEFANSSF